ncbi:hypothetical protein [Prescottella sp. R16]|uniref:hypothetical protein n=1 Tax=Prescottella sp. R16 TaxID=3064529 RepID=UPI00272E1B81|nr:hypothetical protein [Prescottella sp. R16]
MDTVRDLLQDSRFRSTCGFTETAVLQQVTNGVHVRMAVLFRLLVGTDEVA